MCTNSYMLVNMQLYWGSLGGSNSKESACNAVDPGLIPGLGRYPGEGNAWKIQYSCLKNPTHRGTWWATVQRVAKNWTWLSRHTHTRMIPSTNPSMCVYIPVWVCRSQWGTNHLPIISRGWEGAGAYTASSGCGVREDGQQGTCGCWQTLGCSGEQAAPVTATLALFPYVFS